MSILYFVGLKIKGVSCLVVGGGEVAERKVKGLLKAEAMVTVVAPEITAYLSELAAKGLISHCRRSFCVDDLKGRFLVIAATDDQGKNREIAKLSRLQNIMVNVVDSPEESDYFVPSQFFRGDLSIAVSTHGKVPALSKKIRTNLETQFGKEYGPYISLLEMARKQIYESTKIGLPEKKRLIEKLLKIEILNMFREGKQREAEGIMSAFLEKNGV
jgi:precorrin-2 dehydrogenase/sirohydrochlorin ferrochelatase